MNNYNEIERDIVETIEENREVSIFNNDKYYHFYKENNKVVSCNKDGYKEKEFETLEDLLNEIGINENNYNEFDIEMY